MEVRVTWLFIFLNLMLMVQFIESNRGPPVRPPPWRNPNQHHGRGGMPIPIHGDNFANRRIYNGPPPPGPPNKFQGPPPPMRNRLPPPGYFNKQRRPPPPPPYGGYNQQIRPPVNHGPPPPYGFNNMNKQQWPGPVVPPNNFYQNQNGYSDQGPPVYPTPPVTSAALPPPPTTHQQQTQQLQPQQSHQQFQQSNNQASHQQQIQQPQVQPSYQPQNQHPQPQPSQQPTQNLQNPQPTNSNQAPWSQPFPYPNTTQIVGTIQPSQQTAQSNQHMTIVKPDPPKPSSTSQPQQIYQFHLPSGNNQQPNSIIQIHLSSTTESPKEGSGGKEYFTGSTFKPQKYEAPNAYPNTEYLPYEKPKTTPSPALNFKEMNADKTGPYERPVVYKDAKEEDARVPPKSHHTKPGQLIDFTTEAPYISPGSYQRPNQQNKPDFEPGQEAPPSHQRPDSAASQSQFSKSDYEHALTPPSKHDYGLLPPVPKHDYGLTPLAKHDYEHYKNYKEYANKYSQLDPLYHPDGEPKVSNEEDPNSELTLPARYDNSFSTNYKHEEQDAYQDAHYKGKDRKRPQGEPKPQPEEILSALGLSTNPLDHVDIVKTANDKYKKEPLYSLPDRQIEDEEDDDDSKEVGYPGTSYNMPEKSASASRLHPMKRPAPPEMIHPRIKGLSPPALSSHVPDHREDDIITADGSSEYFQPKITHREDTPHYGRQAQGSRPRHPAVPRYPGPPDYSYSQDDRDQPSPPPPGYRGPTAAPPHYHGPTGQPGYGHPIYVTEPDPIIEIIVQDSNVTLPTPPRPKPTTPAPVTPEPVHVFYVRYSNNNNNSIIGSASENQNLRLEAPIPALAVKGPDGQFRPPPNYQQQQQHFNNVFQQYQQPQAQASQPQPNYVPAHPGATHYNGQGSHFTHPLVNGGNPHFVNPGAGGIQEAQFQPTTMRAIIRLDKNEFESNQLKVAFEQTNPFAHLHQQQQHQPQAEASQQQYTHANPPNNPSHSQSNLQKIPSQFQDNNQFVQNQHPQAQQQQQQFLSQKAPVPQQQQFINQNFPGQHQNQPVHQQNSQFQYPQHQQQQSQHVPRFSQQVSQFQGHQGYDAQASQSQHHEVQPQASNQNHQITQFQLPQSQSPSSQFRQGNNEHIIASHQIAQFQQPTTYNPFHQQQPQQPQEIQQPQASNQNHQTTQFQLPHAKGPHPQQSLQRNHLPIPQQIPQFQQVGIQENQHQGNHVPISQVPRFQLSENPENQNQGDSQVYSHLEPQVSPSEIDFNMEPMWTNWNQHEPQQQHGQQQHQQVQQQHQAHQQQQQVQQQNLQVQQEQHQVQQQQHQVQQQDQSPAASTNTNIQQQVQIAAPQAPPQSQSNYNPIINYGGGEPLGLSGLHTIGTENNMRFENPIGLRPPPGPVYPKLGSFQKRIGLDDLATLLGEESSQHQQQIQDAQEQLQSHSHQQQQEESPLISATYHDPDQSSPQKQERLEQELPQQYSASQEEKMSKLPDDVPDELKKQLLESGILGNAEVQVINYDQNLYRDLTNLPSQAIESFQQSDDISKLLGSASRSVRSILVVNEKRSSLRPKRKEASNKLLLFIEDKKTLIYDIKKRSVVTVENKFIQNAIDHTHHKIN